MGKKRHIKRNKKATVKEKFMVKENHKKFMVKLTRRSEIITLSILFLIAFFVRMLTYNSIFVGNNIRFLEFDPFYHMRRAVSFAENFPHIWNFDTYINFPYGEVVGWPPLYDWVIALISNIFGLGHPSRHLIETIGVYFPVFIGSLSVIVIYFLSKEIFSNGDKTNDDTIMTNDDTIMTNDDTIIDNTGSGFNKTGWKIGIISGLLLAIIPAFTQVSFLGFVDHHVAEVLLSSTMYLFFLKALKTDNARKRFVFLFVAGFILILAVLTWSGTPIFIGIIFVYILVQSIIDKSYKRPFAIIGVILALGIGLYFVFPATYQNLESGIGFLLKERTVLQQVKETQPLFFTFEGRFTLEPAWYAFNAALYIAIVSIILIIVRILRHSLALTRARVMFLVWTLIVLILNLYQTRFIYLFAVNVVILCAYLISELIDYRSAYIKVIGIIMLIAILIPSIQTDNTMVQYPLMLSGDWFTSLEWLKDNTPYPISNGGNSGGNSGGGNGSYYEGINGIPSKDHMPEYGIMSWWDYGNYILYLSERPVVANNFQLGAEDSANFLASENESDANQIMDKRKAKYVIVDYGSGLNIVRSGNKFSIRGKWISVAFLSGKSYDYYLDKGFPNQNYLNTTYAKLYLFDGKGMENYKLIYKSPTHYPDIFNKPIEEIKIFQYTGS